MPRIASLIASATEIVHALGFGGAQVARSHECDYPPRVLSLPSVTGPRFPTDGTSYQIDQRVKALVQEALSVYRVDGERLRALEPDLVLTQTQCEVCAVSLRDVEAALAEWTGGRPRIVSLAPSSLGDVWDDVRRVAAALGAPSRGEALARELESRAAAVSRRARSTGERPTVVCIEWIEPPMAAGNWVPELVSMAGGVELLGRARRHSPWMAWEDLIAADSDVLVVLPCGFDIRRTLAEMPVLAGRPGWADLAAVRAGRVAVADGVRYFNRPGPRLVESLEILAEILHPGIDFGHEGDGWVAWPAAGTRVAPAAPE